MACVDGYQSANLLFQSNVQGADNSGLQTNLAIDSDGQVGVGAGTVDYALSQFTSISTYDGYYSGVLGAGAYATGSGVGGDGIFAEVGPGKTDEDTSGYAGFFYDDVYVNGTLVPPPKTLRSITLSIPPTNTWSTLPSNLQR